MITKQQSIKGRVPYASVLIALTVIILFGCSQKAFAQQWSTSGNDISNSNSGNVGVGTTPPGMKLDILSSVNLIARFGSTAGANSEVLIDAPNGFNSNLTLQRGGISKWSIGNRAPNDRFSFIESSGAIERQTLLQDGRVGIGTTNPPYSLDVNGGTNGFRAKAATTSSSDTIATFENANAIQGAAVSSVFGRTGAVVAVTNDYTWAQINKTTSSLGDLQTRNAGHLNAGTVPLARLGLSGTAGVSTFLRGDNTWAPVPGSQWTSGTNNISYNAGNVGIGTASPVFVLDVLGNTSDLFRIRNSSGQEYFSTTTRTGPFGAWPVVSLAGARFIIDSTSPDGNNDTIVRRLVNHLIFKPSDNPALPGAFMVTQAGGSTILYAGQNTNGNVGIGTTTPGAKLEVAGNVNVTGTGNITAAGTIEGLNVKAKYQDVAEWVESSQELPTGTLVVLDHTKINQVIASSEAYDTRVAGVISEQPGITLGEGGANKVLVATTGRVRLTVDASNGPIQIGDLLVTSEIRGVAMKSQAIKVGGVQIHRPGTLVGKALEPLGKGQGKILVLLSLQ